MLEVQACPKHHPKVTIQGNLSILKAVPLQGSRSILTAVTLQGSLSILTEVTLQGSLSILMTERQRMAQQTLRLSGELLRQCTAATLTKPFCKTCKHGPGNYVCRCSSYAAWGYQNRVLGGFQINDVIVMTAVITGIVQKGCSRELQVPILLFSPGKTRPMPDH